MSKINLQNNKACPAKLEQSRGYTIIETMIAVSIFLVIITIGMDTLLNANLVHRKSQDMRSIMDNLSFIMEDMSRSLRTGYNYHCSDNLSGLTTALSCPNGGKVIAFESAYGETSNLGDQWVYVIDSEGKIQKSTASGTFGTFVELTISPEIKIDPTSNFFVIGAKPPNPDGSGDYQQPLVTIRLIGEINYKGVKTPFSLQTSVSQRLVDIMI